MFICNLHCQLFYVFPVICYIKTRPDAKFSIVPEEGWFGQPKYSTRSKKTFYVVSVSAFIFFILFVKPIRSLLIQRIGKIFVYKHCFCYLNVQSVKQKSSLFHQPIVLWLAH